MKNCSIANGFTLIELLIVVAIIAILAAIAVPNFLEAQTRSKVSRCVSDMRTMVTAIESYAVDNSKYPPYGRITQGGQIEMVCVGVGGKSAPDQNEFAGVILTTPIAYIQSIPLDPFASGFEGPKPFINQLNYISMRMHLGLPGAPGGTTAQGLLDQTGDWRMIACGPDCDRGYDCKFMNLVYDATNGTVSDGDIVRTQRNPQSAPRL